MGMIGDWATKAVTQMAIAFIMRQVQKFGKKIDWDKLQIDLDKRVADIIPGHWFDDEAVKLVNSILNAVRIALGEKERIEGVLTFISQEKWEDAFKLLKDYVVVYWNTSTIAEAKTKDAIFESLC